MSVPTTNTPSVERVVVGPDGLGVAASAAAVELGAATWAVSVMVTSLVTVVAPPPAPMVPALHAEIVRAAEKTETASE